jgi:hypothetical protein
MHDHDLPRDSGQNDWHGLRKWDRVIWLFLLNAVSQLRSSFQICEFFVLSPNICEMVVVMSTSPTVFGIQIESRLGVCQQIPFSSSSYVIPAFGWVHSSIYFSCNSEGCLKPEDFPPVSVCSRSHPSPTETYNCDSPCDFQLQQSRKQSLARLHSV